MKPYTVASLNKGAGLFDHVMRSFREYPSRHKDMPTEVAIGVVAAAMKSGLSETDITKVFDEDFQREDSVLLNEVRRMYNGVDDRVHLWHALENGQCKLSHHIDWYSNPDWRLAREHSFDLFEAF